MVRVLALGCFDGLHIGHVKHLQAASALGDKLIVGLTADEAVNKGPGRPVFPWNERCDMLHALRYVDTVVQSYDPIRTMEIVSPDIYVKGSDYSDLPEQKWAELRGIKVIILKTTPVYSSTKLLSGEYLRDRISKEEGSVLR
jgi:rfaE bifunctional protein nucleotidyltransferase chain/domain